MSGRSRPPNAPDAPWTAAPWPEEEFPQDDPSEGFYAGQFRPEELADLVALGTDLTLVDEIACARVALRRVVEVLNGHREGRGREEAPPMLPGFAAPPAGLTPAEYARLGALAFAGARTIARLLRDQRALSGDAADGIAGALGYALDEISTLWGVDL